MKLRSINTKIGIIITLILLLFFIAALNYYFDRVLHETEYQLKKIISLEKSYSDLLLEEKPLSHNPTQHGILTNQYAALRRDFVDLLSDTEDDLLATRRFTLDKKFFLDREASWLKIIVNESLNGLVNSVRYIHEHHIAYMKNIMRRGLIEQDYDIGNSLQRDPVKSAPEIDIIKTAVSIQTYLFDIKNVFNDIEKNPNLLNVKKDFSNKIGFFFSSINAFENYSLDAQDGILVEELFLNGRKFDKSFLSLVAIEQNRRDLMYKLEEKNDALLKLLTTKGERIKFSNGKIKKTIRNLQFLSLILTIFLVSWVIFLARQIMSGTSRTVTETKRIQSDISYQIQLDDSVSDEFQIVYNALNSMTYDLNNYIKQLKESESKINAMLRSIGDHMIMIDKNLNIIWANGVVEALFGNDIIGKKCHEVYFNRKEPCISYTCATLKTLKDGITHQHEAQLIDPKGEQLILHCTTNVALKDREGNPASVLQICRDITNQRKTESAIRENEEKLARSKRMESIGIMAGGIAHDLNNILSGIVSYPDLLLMDLPEDSPLVEPLKVMKDSGKRAADVVSDLLTVARGVATGKEVMNLNKIIEEYFYSAEYKKLEKMNPSMVFKVDLDSELLKINCSPTHIKKTIMNLVTNASEAIDKNGTIVVKTMNRYLDEPLSGYEHVRQGEYAILSVSDDGVGVSEKDLKKIFEPFYTRKVMGRSGTGLGLAVVWNAVRDHEGYINVKSGDQETIFELYFPITRALMVSEEEHLLIEDYKGNGEKILIVDDESQQREIASMLLNRLGYKTETVSSGEEAIEYLKKHSVDLMILDMIMFPGMNGRETYEKTITINQNQKAIIASGFAETEDVKEALKLGVGSYIKKPYTLEKISVAVREELKKPN